MMIATGCSLHTRFGLQSYFFKFVYLKERNTDAYYLS